MRTTAIGLVFSAVAGFTGTSPAMAEAPGPLPPPFLLVGVIIPEAGEPIAITEDLQTHEQEIHQLGAQIGGGRLTKILKDRVVITSGEVAIEVRLAGPVPPPPRPPAPPRPAARGARPSVPR
jgi:hypothetical protein